MSNFNLGIDPELIVRMYMMYSASVKARRSTDVLFTENVLDLKKIKIDPSARNRNVEILHVYLKSIGLKLVSELTDEDVIKDILPDNMSIDEIQDSMVVEKGDKKVLINPIKIIRTDELYNPITEYKNLYNPITILES